jgi:hypothetical protein
MKLHRDFFGVSFMLGQVIEANGVRFRFHQFTRRGVILRAVDRAPFTGPAGPVVTNSTGSELKFSRAQHMI